MSHTRQSASPTNVVADTEVEEVEVKRVRRNKKKHPKLHRKETSAQPAATAINTATVVPDDALLQAKNTIEIQSQIENIQQHFQKLIPGEMVTPALALYCRVINFISSLDKTTYSFTYLNARQNDLEKLLKLILQSADSINLYIPLKTAHDSLLAELEPADPHVKQNFTAPSLAIDAINSFEDCDLILDILPNITSQSLNKLQNQKYFLQARILLQDQELLRILNLISNKPAIIMEPNFSSYCEAYDYKSAYGSLSEKYTEMINLGAALYDQKENFKTALLAEIHRLEIQTTKISEQLKHYQDQERLYFSPFGQLTAEAIEARTQFLKICTQEHADQQREIASYIDFLKNELIKLEGLVTSHAVNEYIENSTGLINKFSEKPKSLQEILSDYNEESLCLLHGFTNIASAEVEFSLTVVEHDAHPEIKAFRDKITDIESEFNDIVTKYLLKRKLFLQQFLNSLSLSNLAEKKALTSINITEDDTTVFNLELEQAAQPSNISLEDCYYELTDLQKNCLRLKAEWETTYQALNKKALQLSTISKAKSALPPRAQPTLQINNHAVAMDDGGENNDSRAAQHHTSDDNGLNLPDDNSLRRIMIATSKSAQRNIVPIPATPLPERSLWQRIGGYILGGVSLILGGGLGGLGGFLITVGVLPIGIPLVCAGGILCISGALSINNTYNNNTSYEKLVAIHHQPLFKSLGEPSEEFVTQNTSIPKNKLKPTQPSPIPTPKEKRLSTPTHKSSDSPYSQTPDVTFSGFKNITSTSAPSSNNGLRESDQSPSTSCR